MSLFDRARSLFARTPVASAPATREDAAPTAAPPPAAIEPWRAPVVLERDPFPTRESVVTYLSGIREDNLLDGLISGGSFGRSGGGWTNPVTGHGTFGRDKVMQGRYEEPFRLTDTELSSLYNGNDIAQRIITAKPNEMFRRGWKLVVPQDKPASNPFGAAGRAPGSESGSAAPGTPLTDPAGASEAKAPPATAPASPGDNKTLTDKPAKPAPGAAPPPEAPQAAKAPGAPNDAGKAPADGKAGANSQDAGAELALQIEKYADNLGLRPKAHEATIFGRQYGGGILIVGADDGQDPAEPIDEQNIKTITHLTWIDRRFVLAAEWYTELGPKYGEVAVWEIINPFGGSNAKIHESRVIRFDGSKVDFLMRRRLLGWTLSVLQAPYDVMRQFDLSFQSIANLMADLSQAVMKIQGLAQLISNDQKTLQTRMQMVDMSRSSSRMLYVDAENEAFERTPSQLTGIADTLEMQMLRLAAAAEMPVAILFGREPSGLNATGDADFRRFYDTIAGDQKKVLEPQLRRLYTLICLAKDSPTKGVLPAKGLEFVWHKLYEPSEKEQSEIRFNMAQADDLYVQNQVLLPEEVALSRFRNGDLNLDTEVDLELRRTKMQTAELPPSGAEKAKMDQENKQAEMKIKAAGVQAKDGPPGAGKPPAAGA